MKSIKDFYKTPRGIFGVRGNCNKCVKLKQHAKTQSYKIEQILLTGFKPCTKCKEILTLEMFHKGHARAGLVSWCKSCVSKSCKKIYKIKKDIILESHKYWRFNNLDKCKKLSRKWKKNNPERHASNEAKRRAAKLQRTPLWSNLDKIRNIYINCPKGMEVDHIIPLQGKNISGLHVPENLQYLTKSENSSKSNKWEV